MWLEKNGFSSTIVHVNCALRTIRGCISRSRRNALLLSVSFMLISQGQLIIIFIFVSGRQYVVLIIFSKCEYFYQSVSHFHPWFLFLRVPVLSWQLSGPLSERGQCDRRLQRRKWHFGRVSQQLRGHSGSVGAGNRLVSNQSGFDVSWWHMRLSREICIHFNHPPACLRATSGVV